MEVTLDKMRPGDRGEVSRVTGEGALRRRLFDMGLTPGATLMVRKVAPFGDPMELTLRGYQLSIRKADARLVVVTKE